MKQILDTLEQVIPQGVEIQLKILQTLVSLLTTTVGGAGNRRGERLVQGDELGQVRYVDKCVVNVVLTPSLAGPRAFAPPFDVQDPRRRLNRLGHPSPALHVRL